MSNLGGPLPGVDALLPGVDVALPAGMPLPSQGPQQVGLAEPLDVAPPEVEARGDVTSGARLDSSCPEVEVVHPMDLEPGSAVGSGDGS